MRQIIIHKADEDETGYWAECPSLPGCYSQGETIDEIIANMKDAIQLWIDDAIEHGEPVPEDTFDIVVMTV